MGSMSPPLMVVLLSVLAAVAYAFAAVAQERLAAGGSRGPMRYVQPGFLLAVVLNAGGAGLHVLALRHGPLAVVQSFSTLTLIVALPIGAALARRPVTHRQWRGAIAAATGLAGILLAADTGVPVEALRNDEIPRVAALSGAILASLALTRTRLRRGRCLRLAAGSGMASGVASVLAQTQLLRMGNASADRVITVAVAGTALLIAAFAVTGLLLAQAAYRCGLGAPLATLTIVNPMAAAAIGFILLGQGSTIGAGSAVVAVAAAALAAYGVVLLAAAEPALPGPPST